MTAEMIISSLPPYAGNQKLIATRQNVYDIIAELLEAHQLFAKDYDLIAAMFDGGTVPEICNRLFDYCKKNIRYQQEPEGRQTTKSPAAMLTEARGDCKHYASFCAGILDALNRSGKKIKWVYRFASYSLFDTQPEHVFVVVWDKGKEIWVDPTPGADKIKPVWYRDKRVKKMALYRISGTPTAPAQLPFIVTDDTLTTPLEMAIALLYSYGAMNDKGQISEPVMKALQNKVDPYTYARILEAQKVILSAVAMGSIFSKVWTGVKKVTLSVPRNAFLSLVAVNAFNMGKKMYNSLYNKDGSYTSFKDRLKNKWESLGGSFSALERAIKSGYRKAKVSGIGAAPAIPAWVAVAGAVITAIMPLVNAFLRTRQPQELPVTDYDFRDFTTPTTPAAANNNMLLIAGGVAAVFLLTRKK